MYHSQVKALQAHGPASSYCLPAIKMVLAGNVIARLNGWWELAFRLTKWGLSLCLH